MIKAIATDLDGTLFYPKRKLRLLKSQNKKFLKKLIEKNIEIVLVTGRNRSIAEKIERKTGTSTKLSMVGCSGSLVIHKGEVIRERPMDKEAIKQLLQVFDEDKRVKTVVFMGNFRGMLMDNTHLPGFLCPLAVFVLHFQGVYYEHSRFGRKKIMDMLNDDTTKIYKVMPILGTSDHSKKGMKIAKELAEEMRTKCPDSFEFFESGTAVEIVAKGTNKAESLSDLFEKYGIKKDEVLVVGDSGNDIPMLEEFPNSFAMSQAPEYVKRSARNEIKYVYELEKYI